MRAALFLALTLALAGCVSSSVVEGINPVVGCTQDSQCAPGYYCQGGGCQVPPRTCTGPGDTVDCEVNETCVANLATGCTDPSSGQDCPAKYICQRNSSGTTGGSTGGTTTSGGPCTTVSCADAGGVFSATSFFTNYCNLCHTWTCASPASEPLMIPNLENGSMPPSDAPQPTDAQVNAIIQWINCGSPQ